MTYFLDELSLGKYTLDLSKKLRMPIHAASRNKLRMSKFDQQSTSTPSAMKLPRDRAQTMLVTFNKILVRM